MISFCLVRFSILILAVLLIYGQTFHFGFVFDDHAFIVNNAYLKSFSQFPLIWKSVPMTRLVGMYTFALNYHMNGLDPAGYHIFNVLLHLVVVGVVWALAQLLFGRYFPPAHISKDLGFIVALLFLVHPCQTQAVSYISQRFESMAALFYLGAIYFYLRARLSITTKHKIILSAMAALCSVLGIMTKETAITIPAMMLAAEWILFPGKKQKGVYVFLAVFWVVLYVLFTLLLHDNFRVFTVSFISKSHDGDLLTPAKYFLTQMRVFLTFLRLLIYPVAQNVDYDYPASNGLFSPPLTLVGLMTIIGFVVLVIKLRRKFPLVAFGLAWVLITFSINLAPRENVIFEHKLYLISFGFFLAAVTALSVVIKNRRALLMFFCCLVVALGLASYERNQVWRNELTLWDDAAKKSPHKARAYNNRGFAYENLGQFNKAIQDLNKSIALDGHDADAYNNRGRAYFYEGNLGFAMEDYNKSILLNPDSWEVYLNRGEVFSFQSEWARAFSDYQMSLALNPNQAEAHNDLGNIYLKEGKTNDAIEEYDKAIAVNPSFAGAYNDRAIVFYQLKEYDKAWGQLRKAAALGYAVAPQLVNILRAKLRHY